MAFPMSQQGHHYRYLQHQDNEHCVPRRRQYYYNHHQEHEEESIMMNGLKSRQGERRAHAHVSLLLPTHQGTCPLCQTTDIALASSPTCAATTRAAAMGHAICEACWQHWLQACEETIVTTTTTTCSDEDARFTCPTCRGVLPSSMVTQLLGRQPLPPLRQPRTTVIWAHDEEPSSHEATTTTNQGQGRARAVSLSSFEQREQQPPRRRRYFARSRQQDRNDMENSGSETSAEARHGQRQFRWPLGGARQSSPITTDSSHDGRTRRLIEWVRHRRQHRRLQQETPHVLAEAAAAATAMQVEIIDDGQHDDTEPLHPLRDVMDADEFVEGLDYGDDYEEEMAVLLAVLRSHHDY